MMKDWIDLQLSIRQRLCNLEGVDQRGFTAEIQYSVFPSFTDSVCLDILTPTGGGDTVAFQTTWDFERDFAAFSTPTERIKHPVPFVPAFITKQLKVPPGRLDEIIRTLRTISIPMHANHACGLDGTSYELQLGSFFGWCRIKWWADLPEEWKPISTVVRRLNQLLNAKVES